jgi:hypothetical protein
MNHLFARISALARKRPIFTKRTLFFRLHVFHFDFFSPQLKPSIQYQQPSGCINAEWTAEKLLSISNEFSILPRYRYNSMPVFGQYAINIY